MRIFSGHVRDWRLFCHCACRSSMCSRSVIQELPFKRCQASAKPCRAARLLIASRLTLPDSSNARMRVKSLARPTLSAMTARWSARTTRNGHALEVGGLGLFHRLLSERTERGHKLRGPRADTNSFAFRPVSPGGAELVNTIEHVKPVRGGHRHEHIGIQRRHRFGVPHLRDRAKQRVIPDHAHPLHLIEQLRQFLHDFILSKRRVTDSHYWKMPPSLPP